MSHRYFVELSYDGTPFHGWQIQPNAKTIQQSLNEALSTVCREEIYCVGCGRTDTGVHARQFFAHFDLEHRIEHPADTAFHANCILPSEIAIHRIFEVDAELHARFSATSRTYEYLITNRKDPFSVHRAYEFRETLDLDLMNQACDILMSYEDFESFSKSNSDADHFRCEMKRARWSLHSTGLRFEIEANRFLRNMVRAVVGTMISIGTGKTTPDDLKRIIEAKNRSEAGTSAPAHGLYLINVTYPESSFSS